MLTLDQIEGTKLPKFNDPRLYFAIGRGTVGGGRLGRARLGRARRGGPSVR